MITPRKILATLVALAALAAAPSAIARVNCHASDLACLALHASSSAAERARTRALNCQSRGAPAVANMQYDYAMDDRYAREQEQYRRDMQDYRRAQQRYEEALRRSRTDRYGSGSRMDTADRDACRAMASAPSPQPGMSWSDEAWAADHDAFAPTGGKVDPRIAAPVPGLSGSTAGLTAFNARASGLQRSCAAPRGFNRYR